MFLTAHFVKEFLNYTCVSFIFPPLLSEIDAKHRLVDFLTTRWLPPTSQ